MARNRQKAPIQPVSGPGRMSSRTDLSPQGSAASRGQPVRVASGGAYGDRQRLEQQQQAAPLAAGRDPGQHDPRVVDAATGPVSAAEGVFGPTQRPGEPNTAGIPMGAGPGASVLDTADPDAVLQAAYALFPHPELLRALMGDGNIQ